MYVCVWEGVCVCVCVSVCTSLLASDKDLITKPSFLLFFFVYLLTSLDLRQARFVGALAFPVSKKMFPV
jgi:hypothetical protein